MKIASKRQILKISLIFSFLIGFLGFFSLPFSVRAATITVTDTTGTDADNGLCSIVEAIQNANANNQSGSVDCEAGAGTDTISITVDISVNGAVVNGGGYTHTATEFITESVVIDGNDHEITNTLGNGLNFFGSLTAGVDISISDLTFSDGDTTTAVAEEEGGAITLVGMDTLTLDNVTFNNNTADNGGAVYAESLTGSIIITDSYFTLNRAPFGGGGVFYLDDSDLTVTNSYFFDNRTETSSGGVFYATDTGGNPILTVTKSTFETNFAGNGGVFYINNGVTLEVTNSSFDANVSIDNGGVIYSFQTNDDVSPNEIEFSYNTDRDSVTGENGGTTFYNCIDEGGCSDNLSSGITGDHYFFENNILSGCDGNIQNAAFLNNLDGNFGLKCSETGIATASTNVSSALADNGGSWRTFAPSTGSNAIDTGVAGTLGCPSTDGRGRVRPYNSLCDIGAFEFAPDTVTVTQSGGTTDVTEDGATDTFTIFLESYPTADVTITFDGGDQATTSPTSVTFVQADWPETKTVTISAIDDDEDEDSTHAGAVSFAVTSGDAGYNGYSIPAISVSIADNDSSGTTGSGGGPSGDDDDDEDPTEEEPEDEEPIDPPPPPIDPIDPPEDPPIEEEDPELPDPIDEPDPSDEPTDPSDEEGEPPFPGQNENSENALPENRGIFEEIADLPKEIAGAVIDFVEEIPKETAGAVSVIGVAFPTLAFAVTQPAVATNLLSIPIRLWNLIPIWLGFRRKKRPWGTVFDSVTKQPLDPVYVTLKDLRGREIATTITDLDGRFGFLVAPGRYKIVVRKDNYEFPSKKLAGKQSDELYSNLYNGEEIDIIGGEDLVIRNIAMDSTSFNWNEFEKAKNKKLMKFYSKRDIFLAHIAGVAFWGGLICSLILMFTGPSTLNYILLGVYAVVLILRLFGVKPKQPGSVTEASTGFPLSFGIVRIFSAALNKEIAHAIISKTGKYYTLVPNGNYYMKIEKKTGEDSYTEVFKSEAFPVKKGFIGKVFRV